jgi:hypothetical protein
MWNKLYNGDLTSIESLEECLQVLDNIMISLGSSCVRMSSKTW